MTIENYICNCCGGGIKIKGYIEKYFVCVKCGARNNIKRAKVRKP